MPMSRGTQTVENPGGLEIWPKDFVVDPIDQHAEGRFPSRPYHPWLHKGIGVAVMGLLQWLSLRYTSWPIAPVGYLTFATWLMQMACFSIFLGWLAKIIVVRLGGVRLYDKLGPLFLGLIFGESIAAVIWLLVALILAATGQNYQPIQMLPY